MGRQLDLDPAMLDNLDLLMDFEAAESEENWQALANWDEKESAEEVKEQADAEETLETEGDSDD